MPENGMEQGNQGTPAAVPETEEGKVIGQEEPKGTPTPDGGMEYKVDGKGEGEPQPGEGEAGEPGSGEEGQPGAAPASPAAPAPQDQILELVHNLQNQISDLQGQVKGQAQRGTQTTVTKEQITDAEEKYGITADGLLMINKMVRDSNKTMLDHLNGKISSMGRGSAIDEMTSKPEFSDIGSMRNEIQEIMNQMYAPEVHSDQRVIASAYYEVKGRNSGKAIRRARNGSDRNLRIGGSNRPMAPSGPAGRTGSRTVKLTAVQESARAASGMSVADYTKNMRRK